MGGHARDVDLQSGGRCDDLSGDEVTGCRACGVRAVSVVVDGTIDARVGEVVGTDQLVVAGEGRVVRGVTDVTNTEEVAAAERVYVHVSVHGPDLGK